MLYKGGRVANRRLDFSSVSLAPTIPPNNYTGIRIYIRTYIYPYISESLQVLRTHGGHASLMFGLSFYHQGTKCATIRKPLGTLGTLYRGEGYVGFLFVIGSLHHAERHGCAIQLVN